MKFKLKTPKLVFGGADLRSSPKESRPIDTKSAMHLTMKSKKSILRLPRTVKVVNQEVRRACVKYNFPLYQYSNNFNHLHILLRIKNRHRWRAFIRELTGGLARELRTRVKLEESLWLGRPFTRIIKGWGRNYRRVKEYIRLNIIEAENRLTREQAKAYRDLKREFG